MRHLVRRCPSGRVPAQRVAGGDEPAMQSDIHRYRLAYGKGAAMKVHHIFRCRRPFHLGGGDRRYGSAADQFRPDANELGRCQQYQSSADRPTNAPAVLDNIRNSPGALPPPRPLSFPQLENLAQFVVEVDFDFNSAVIRPSSYRTIGAIADALHNPILLGYGFL